MPFFLIKKKQIPVYADPNTKKYLLSTFKYCFKSSYGYPSTLNINSLKKKHEFIIKDKKIKIENSVKKMLLEEEKFGIKKFKTYKEFGKKVYKIRENVIKNLKKLKKNN